MTISAPTFEQAVAGLSGLALLHPDSTARHAYVDSAGAPHDLAGHLYRDLGGDPAVFLGRDDRGRVRNTLRISSIWEDVFSGYSPVVHAGEDENQSWRMRATEEQDAFLAYGLLSAVQTANDHSGRPWRGSVLLGVRNFRRFLVSKSSGFIVQLTHGDEHGKAVYPPAGDPAYDLLARADEATKLMRAALS